MVNVLADEDFNGHILRGVHAFLPGINIARVVDLHSGATDPDVLELAANARRVLLTHDVNTMSAYLKSRIVRGLPVPGVIFVHQHRPIGPAIRALQFRLGQSNDPADFIPPIWV